VEVLKSVDRLILLEIYSAGEEPIDGISSTSLLESIKNTGLENALLAKSNAEAYELIENIILKEKGVLLIQGAGNISEISAKLTQKIEK